ncbi:MAG: hypothetical protein M1814_002755 [Vezdaea aestivalis]|nr:MAG: hypothetical protein M1814_002755 [Vezdaea aestivalis]
MAEEKEKQRMVIAIDYGTTYTGVAYCDGFSQRLDSIELISDWPGYRRNVTDEKVPSQIAYGSFEGPDGIKTDRLWGNLIGPELQSDRYVWTKLLLDQDQDQEEPLHNMLQKLFLFTAGTSQGVVAPKDPSADAAATSPSPNKPTRQPLLVVTDFLTEVRKFVFQTMEERLGKVLFQTTDVEIVFTVPAVWSERARELTHRAVSNAAFGRSQNQSSNTKISIVTEPEAAAVYTMKSIKESVGGSSLQVGDHFILCDAGGGTVDLLSYRIKNLDPRFQIEEAAVGTGDKCGSTFVDRAFLKWLRNKIGDSAFENIPPNKVQEGSKIRREFEAIKHHFDGSVSDQYITVPREAKVKDDLAKGIEDGDITITSEDLAEMFKFTVDRTIELISGQMTEMQGRGRTVKSVFLVGGFGKSTYLFRQIQTFLKARDVEVLRPKHPWSAVVRGACLQGLDSDTEPFVSGRVCRLHYGCSLTAPFSVFLHQEKHSIIDPVTGEKKAVGNMSWMMKKGAEISTVSAPVMTISSSKTFNLSGPFTCVVELFSCSKDIPPSLAVDSGVDRICTLNVDMSSVPREKFQRLTKTNGEPYYLAKASIHIKVDNKRLKFSATIDGQDVGNLTARFDG